MSDVMAEHIAPFQYHGFFFCGGTLFSKDDAEYCMLVSDTGHSFFSSRSLAERIKNRTPSPALCDKLTRKGFCFGDQHYDIYLCRKVVPTFFIIDITTKCNMNCYYCLRHFEDSGETISEARLRDILDYIIAHYYTNGLDCIDIQPWGGEPTLAVDRIIFMRSYLDQHGIRANITVQTNALSLTDDIIDKLQQSRVSVGVSIDGCETIHDLHRKDIGGRPTFVRVTQNIHAYCKRTGNMPGMIGVLSRMSLAYLEQSMDVLVKELGLQALKFNFMHPNTELFDTTTVVTTDDIPALYEHMINKLISLHEEGYHVIEYNIADRLNNLLAGGGSDICHSHGCTGGYRLVSFSQKGDIYPCEMIGIPEYRLGNIYDGTALPDLINAAIACKNPYFAEKRAPRCTGCTWLPYCRGGCTASARFHHRRPGEIDEKECAVNNAIYPELIGRLLDAPAIATILTDGKILLI